MNRNRESEYGIVWNSKCEQFGTGTGTGTEPGTERARELESGIFWPRTEIDYWTQGLISHRNQKQFSTDWINWIIGAMARTRQSQGRT